MKKKNLITIFVSCLLIFLIYLLLVGAVDYFVSSSGSSYYGNIVWETTLNGTVAGNNFGVSVATGDVNYDGYSDVIVGADKAATPGGSLAGQVYVFFGTPDGIANMDAAYANITLNGTRGQDKFGQSVASGDVNNDSYADVIVGAWGAPGGINQGQVQVFFGADYTSPVNEDAAIYANITINATATTTDRFGYSVAAGDVNNDSYDDVIVGAYYTNPSGATYAGQAYVFFGADFTSKVDPTLTASDYANITINGTAASDYFGWSVAAGDVNNDTYDDIIAGAYYASPSGASLAGQAYVFFGADFTSKIDPVSNASDYANITINGTAASDYFGWSVGSGDVNNDSYADMIVGAPSMSTGNNYVYVFFGADFTEKIDPTSSALSYANITINGTAVGDTLGTSVASGDVNNDSYADVIAGAIGVNSPTADWVGQAYVFFGADFIEKINPTLTALSYANITVNGTASMDKFGISVGSGDVNNDSYADLIVGAYQASPPDASQAGQVYIFGYDDIYPVITLDSPVDFANFSTALDFNYTATDTSLDTCELWGNWSGGWHLNESFVSPGSGSANGSSVLTLAEGLYVWTVYCNDTVGNYNNTFANFTLTVDTSYPLISLDNPADFYNTSSSVIFNYTATDTSLDTCGLWGNWSGGWHLNESFVSPASGETNGSSSLALEEGQYVWTVYCNDTGNNYNNTVDNFTLTVDYTAPLVSIVSPIATTYTSSSVSLDYVAVDDSDHLDTVWYTKDSGVTNTTLTQNVTLSSLSNADYTLILYANDTFGNLNETNVTFTVSVTSTTSGGSSSTGEGGYGPVAVAGGVSRTMSIDDAFILYLGEFGSGSAGGNVGHQTVLDEINSDSVALLIYSSPIKVALNVGETKKIDVDNDSILDVLIKLNSIDFSHNKADIYFEDITPKKEVAPAEEAKEKEVIEENPEVPTGEIPAVPETASKTWLWILIIAVIIVIVIGYYFIKKRNNPFSDVHVTL